MDRKNAWRLAFSGFVVVALAFPPHDAPAGEPPLSQEGETLYNGIVLPKAWPPQVLWEDVLARKALPDPPYLTSPPPIIPIDVGRQLFVDDFVVERTTLTRTYYQARYHPSNPVFRGGMPFSGGVWFDPKDHLFKMWYHAGGTSYTTSRDGIHWEAGKCVLPGRTDSQVVWLDLEEEDPAKRYKMSRSVIANNDCRGQLYVSPDGIRWNHAGETGPWGDRSTFFRNPFRKVWVFSLRHGWGQPRARRYWEARNFEKGPFWEKTGDAAIWVGSDSKDPERPDYKIAPQLYNLDCVAYESLLLGLFDIWRGQPPPRKKPNEVCIGFSRDGFHWSRPDRRAFCPVSEHPGDWNYSNVQSAGGCCLIIGDKLYFYVSGRGDGQVASLATLRRDGFASMDAQEGEGVLTTRPVRFSGKYLFVNADSSAGELRAEILSQSGEVLAPFSRKTCRPIKADRTLQTVTWEGAGDLSRVSGTPVRFRFHLKNGKLFAFWVSAQESGASQGYVAAGGPGFTGLIDTVGSAGAPR